MKKIYIKVDGMMCNHCHQTVTNIIKKNCDVQKIRITNNIVTVYYENSINKENIINEINSKGYITKEEYISENKRKISNKIGLLEFIIILLALILINILLNKLFGFNVFNMIPPINNNITFGMLFVTGLFTSIHCISMCGAINLYASSNNNTNNLKKFKNPLLYNLGRLISYTVLGAIIGGIGKAFSINYIVQSTIILIASIFMITMSLSMLGIITISNKIKTCKIVQKFKTKNSFIIGILNGLMPCGPLQAMQIYALSTASIVYGALSMFLFCLGTIPLMLFFGSFVNLCKGKAKIVINKIASVLIFILSIAMLNRALVGFGFNIEDMFISKQDYAEYTKTIIKDDYQYVEFDLDYDQFKDIIVQKDITVKMIINVDKKHLNGCNNEIVINEYGIKQKLEIGKNEIEFIPQNEGNYIYSCWMNMISNKIKVINNMDFFKDN